MRLNQVDDAQFAGPVVVPRGDVEQRKFVHGPAPITLMVIGRFGRVKSSRSSITGLKCAGKRHEHLPILLLVSGMTSFKKFDRR